MARRGLIAKHPRKFRHLVEACDHLGVVDLIAGFTLEQKRTLPCYVPREHPNIVLVNRPQGCRPWHWTATCPRCLSNVHELHRPPDAEPTDWACRRCHGLQWASRVHGKHEGSPSRRKHRVRPTYFQRCRAEKSQRARERQRVREQRAETKGARERERRLWFPVTPEDVVATHEEAHQLADQALAEWRAEQDAKHAEAMREVQRMIDEDAPRVRAWLEEVAANAPRKREREQAAKILADADRRTFHGQLGIAPSKTGAKSAAHELAQG